MPAKKYFTDAEKKEAKRLNNKRDRENNKDRVKKQKDLWYRNNKLTVSLNSKNKRNSRDEKQRLKDSEKSRQEYKERYSKNLEFINEYKSLFGCSYCGNTDHKCLEFHHINKDEKEFTISHKLPHYSLNKLCKEMAKCDIICRNCHREHHYFERLNSNIYKPKRKQINNRILCNKYKENAGCEICGDKRSYVLDFHHVEVKSFPISEMTIKKEFCEIFKEIKLCKVLCANHHNLEHNSE